MPRPPSIDDLIGVRLDGYVLEARIGSGATGVVYRANRERDGRSVAVKVLNENLGHISSLRRRFEREAKALSRLAHPRIVNINDFGVTSKGTFIAMEILEGDTLEEILADGPVAPKTAMAIVRQTLEGLAFAHELQIVHRDLKPANIFLQFAAGQPSVKVLDFGLAKFLSIDELSEDATLTRRGRIVGTPAYMAPEQITGVSLDVRADVYAVGVLLFELLADRRPFDYPRRSQLLRAHLFEQAPSIREVRPALRIKPALEAIVQRALAKDPNDRFAHAGEMLDALRAVPDEAAEITMKTNRGRRRRIGSNSEVISERERRAVTTGVGDRSEPTEAMPVTVPIERSARSLGSASRPPAPLDTMLEGAPLGGLPASTPSGAVFESDRAILWWIAGVVLSLASGIASFVLVRMIA